MQTSLVLVILSALCALTKATCELDGQIYETADEVPVSDPESTGSCTCTEDGYVACTCKLNEQIYEPGESMPSDDCNYCWCAGGIYGGRACTLMGCPTCTRDGVIYNYGDQIPSGDSCNTCYCLGNNMVRCTLRGCREHQPSIEIK